MTLYEDAFLSLTDFKESPAEVLFFPQLIVEEEKVRRSEVWLRGDYELLSDPELSEAVETFLIGRDIAKRIIQERAALWTPTRPPPGPP